MPVSFDTAVNLAPVGRGLVVTPSNVMTLLDESTESTRIPFSPKYAP